jgi:drug/metabolite transporter (DMT)-like permease
MSEQKILMIIAVRFGLILGVISMLLLMLFDASLPVVWLASGATVVAGICLARWSQWRYETKYPGTPWLEEPKYSPRAMWIVAGGCWLAALTVISDDVIALVHMHLDSNPVIVTILVASLAIIVTLIASTKSNTSVTKRLKIVITILILDAIVISLRDLSPLIDEVLAIEFMLLTVAALTVIETAALPRSSRD